MDYRREIDGLRSLAVIPVILFHAGISGFGGGFVGVDVFFVISGYLITFIILGEQEKGAFSIVKFYERRARRILPALFFVILVSVPFAFALMAPKAMQDFFKSIIAVSLFSSNILFWRESGYFDSSAEMKPLLHTWSLGVEEQYYLFFPIFVLFAWRLGRKAMLFLLVGMIVASLILAEWMLSKSQSATFFLIPSRAWELLVGSVLAFLGFYKYLKLTRSTILREILAWIGLFLIVYAVLMFNEHTEFPGKNALVPVIGAALIIAFADQNTMVGKILGCRILVGVGLLSYSAYLWHQPVFAFARWKFEHVSTLMYLALSFVSMVFAYFSWRYVERPFRNKSFLAEKKIFIFSSVSIVFLIFVGLFGVLEKGFINYSGQKQNLFATAAPSPLREKCHTGGNAYLKPKDACEYFGSNASIAVFGDSHSVEVSYALAKRLKDSGVNASIKQFSFSGCAPSYGRTDLGTPCSKWTDEAVSYIVKNENIKTVVVSYRINSALFGGHEGLYPALPDTKGENERRLVWESYVGVIKEFLKSNKEVVLILQAPELREDISVLVERSNSPNNIFGVSRSWLDKREEYLRSHIKDIPEEVFIVDPSKIFCDKNNCFAVKENGSLYFDDDHLSVFGASLVANEVFEKISPYISLHTLN